MSLDLASIIRQLHEVEAQHPDAATALAPIIEALGGPEESTISIEQARQILGVRTVDTVDRWLKLGILAGRRNGRSEHWQIPLVDVLRLRGAQSALADAGGEDLTEEELYLLSSARPGSFPW